MDPIVVSRLISDEYVLKILAATFREPKSAQELSLKFDIPIAACYRKIRELENAGLLKCTARILTQQGKRVKLYRSQVVNAYIFFEKNKLKVKLELASIPTGPMVTTWNVLEVQNE
jgi:DNA-binding Lrp family transcriptional regulator